MPNPIKCNISLVIGNKYKQKPGVIWVADIYVFKSKEGRVVAKVDIYNVASYFLSCVDVSAGASITHLKLQKLCYYAQAWHLVFNGEPLFEEEFQAWVHGPVCPELWHEYRGFTWHNIPPSDCDSSVFDEKQQETLRAVWDAYGQYDGKYLEELTHQEPPWVSARRGYEPGEICANIISHDSMVEYYRTLLDSDEQS